MTHPFELQAEALTQDILDQVAAERRELLDAARAGAEQVRARARLKARRQMQRAVDEMRAAAAQRRRSQIAQIETAQRQRAMTRAATQLASAGPLWIDAISARWHDPAARAQWLKAQLTLAQSRWPRSPWVLRHPKTWSADDHTRLREMLAALGQQAFELRADPALEVGLIIESDGARLDSTPDALLADRARAEAALLAALEEATDE